MFPAAAKSCTLSNQYFFCCKNKSVAPRIKRAFLSAKQNNSIMLRISGSAEFMHGQRVVLDLQTKEEPGPDLVFCACPSPDDVVERIGKEGWEVHQTRLPLKRAVVAVREA